MAATTGPLPSLERNIEARAERPAGYPGDDEIGVPGGVDEYQGRGRDPVRSAAGRRLALLCLQIRLPGPEGL